MKSLILPGTALVLLAIGLVIHWQHFTPLLPERVASHIDTSGKANQWTDKATFLNGARTFFMIAPLAFLGLAAFSCLAVRYLPAALVNVPYKDYWLATAEHRQRAVVLVARFFLWFAFGLFGLMYFGVVHSMVMATLNPDRNANYADLPVVLLGVIFIFTQVGLLIYQLYHPPQGKRSRKAKASGRNSKQVGSR
jgi:uncharacterized membrane protein